MHPIEQQNAFIFLRANGWSLGKISDKLNLPKSTIFHWECEHRAQIHVMKSMQVEKLQEKYVPSYEEELQHLASYLARVEHALQQHTFDHMRPEFLLQTALHLRGRLNKLRSDISINTPIENTGLQPLAVCGCISRAEKPVLAADYESEPLPDSPPSQEPAGTSPSPLNEERAGVRGEIAREDCVSSTSTENRPTSLDHPRREELCLTAAAPPTVSDNRSIAICDRKLDHQNGTFSHENGVGSKLDASPSDSCNTGNGTTVPSPDRERAAQASRPT